MASVTVMTAAHVQDLIDGVVATAAIDSSGFLRLTLADGVTVIDVGQVSNHLVTDLLVKSAAINGSDHLILTLGDGTTTVDVGSVNPTPVHVDPGLSVVNGAGFGSPVFTARTANGFAAIFLQMTYTGTTITAGSTGNITDTTIATLPVGLRPAVEMVLSFAVVDTENGQCRINTDGTIVLDSMSINGSISSGDVIRVGTTYLLA